MLDKKLIIMLNFAFLYPYTSTIVSFIKQLIGNKKSPAVNTNPNIDTCLDVIIFDVNKHTILTTSKIM